MPPSHGPGTVCEIAACGTAGRTPRHVPPGFGWTVLQRHGRRPLAVMARTLLHADNRCAGMPCWSAITIHETDTAGFAASLCHTPWLLAGPAWRDAWVCDSVEAVRASYFRHDPLWALPTGPMTLTDEPGAADAAMARRFRLAWAGLLAAVFGVNAGPSVRE